MDTIYVGISGINAVDNPGPGSGVARSLKEDPGLRVNVVGLAYDAMEPGIYMEWLFDRAFIMPYPSGSGEAMVERLLYIKEQHGLDCVIPNLDTELPAYIRYADELEKHGIRTFLPTREQFGRRAKDQLAGVAEAIGIQYPRTEVVMSVGSLMKALDDLDLPLMVKGAFYKAHRAYTRQEATGFYHHLVSEWGYPVIVQEVVTGEEMNVVGVGDGKGEALGLVGIKKSWVTSQGKIWTGVTVCHEGMLSAARRFIRHFSWRGPFELECIVTRDGEVYLVEINPRFPAWSYFATGVGQNLPGSLLRTMLGMPVQAYGEYPAGKLYVRYTYELVTNMAPFQAVATKGEK